MPRAKGNAPAPNDPPQDPDKLNEDPLISDLIDTEEEGRYQKFKVGMRVTVTLGDVSPLKKQKLDLR